MAEGFIAIGEIEHAIARTKELLWPFNRSIWLRLALVALFIGGGGANMPSGSSWQTDTLPPGLEDSLVQALPLILLAVAGLFLLALIWGLIGAILQFVFVDLLSSGEWHIRRTFGLRAGKGVRLFLFQVGLLLLVILLAALPAAVIVAPALIAGSMVNISIALAVLATILVLVILLIPVAIIEMFTIDFVVPVMLRDDIGVLDGWQRLWPIIRAAWKEAAVYVLAKIALVIATGILVLLAVLAVFLVLGIIGAIVVIAVHMALGSLLLDAVAAAPFVICALVILLLVQVPVITFYRYYGLLVLGRLAPAYTLLP